MMETLRMPDFSSKPCTAFDGHRLLAAGPLGDVAIAVKAAAGRGARGPVLTFDDTNGAVVDLDLRGSKADILRRLSQQGARTQSLPAEDSEPTTVDSEERAGMARGRGRPKLGVVAREVTLLPRHWNWLAEQPGGASVVLRRLVEEARRSGAEQGKTRARREAAYRFMSAMAGDFAGFEEATRALFAGRLQDFEQHMGSWPEAVRTYALKLALGADAQTTGRKVDPK
jgi:hypothetical protein